jgi:hypothetical protein
MSDNDTLNAEPALSPSYNLLIPRMLNPLYLLHTIKGHPAPSEGDAILESLPAPSEGDVAFQILEAFLNSTKADEV